MFARYDLKEKYRVLHTGWIPMWNDSEVSFDLCNVMPGVGWVLEIIPLDGPEVPGTLEYACLPPLVRGVTHVTGSDRQGWRIFSRGSKFPLGECLYRVRD